MKFSRSTNQGLSFDPIITFNGSTGIGSDITTDSTGAIYYFWPDPGTKTVEFGKSTNGGVSFQATQTVTQTQADYDYPIPAMDQRMAFLYVSCDTDLTGGPFHNRIYACWNDTNTDDDDNNAQANHSRITFAYSSNGGNSWSTSTPHSTQDINQVDRFHPWFEVDNNGTIHVVYYDTRNDVNRRKTDIYYATSVDGGVTWSESTRITSQQSNYINDGFQWGDYNGLSAVLDSVIPIWTDNRTNVNVFTAEAHIQVGQGDFELSAGNLSQTQCKPGAIDPITIDFTALQGFSQPINLSLNNLNAGFNATFTPTQLTPPGSSILTIDITSSVPTGQHSISIEANGNGIMHDLTFNLFVRENQIAIFYPNWTTPTVFDPHYDMDGDQKFTLLDLIALINCSH